MKYINLFLISVLLLIGCSKSSLKYLQKGQYDNAIDKSVKVLLKEPDNSEEINVLSQSYKIANQRDNQKIEQLRLSGQPDIWDAVFNTYSLLQKRQEKVSGLQTSVLNSIAYQYINYNAEIAEAKKKAADYFYVHAQKLLSTNEKYNARTAYDELQKIKSIFPNYKDVNELINKAYTIGNSYVLFKIENNSQSILPKLFINEMESINIADLNIKWTIFHTKAVENYYYDYFIKLNIKMIDISPERLNKNNYSESKQVADGWQYALDSHGNVKKDSLGNDIKIPKFKTIKCNVSEIQQIKACVIAGTLDFINNENKQIIKSEPLRADWFFKNNYATATGDLNALSEESLKKLHSSFIPFPPNADMIMQCSNVLKSTSKEIIQRNARLLK